MTDEQQALWHRLAAYRFDAPDALVPYSRRLAEREGWSPAHTVAVIEEYRRFTFLAVSMDHVATPSKAVDAAWHLHLEYTREYWDVFCAQVLRTRLHHSPGSGAPDEASTYARLYAQTLDGYRGMFGVEPPTAVWPRAQPVDLADGADEAAALNEARGVVFDGARQTPRGNRPHAGRFAWMAGFAAVAASCAYAGEFNVFDYAGPRFLQFYVTLCSCVLLLIIGMRMLTYWLRPWGAHTESGIQHDMWSELMPEDVALLAGGTARMAQIATLGLMHDGAIKFINGFPRTSYVEAVSATEPRRFVAGWEWLCRQPSRRATYQSFHAGLMTQRPAIVLELVERGWLWSRHGMRTTRLASRLLALLVLATGIAKTIIGVGRERPVMLLIACMIVFGAAYLIVTSRLGGLGRAGLTRGARGALYSLRVQLKRDESEPDRLLWKAALLGVNSLTGTLWAGYTTALAAGLTVAPVARAVRASGGSGSDSSSGSSCISSSCSASSCSSSGSCSSSSCGGCSSSS